MFVDSTSTLGSLNQAAIEGTKMAQTRQYIRQASEGGRAVKNTEVDKWRRIDFGGAGRRGSVQTLCEQATNLPIFPVKATLLKTVAENQPLVVIGDTGSKKTTQLPQYLAESGYMVTARITMTQPRQVAAMYVARHVAEETGCHLGQEVGYMIFLRTA
jgi:ATP-dependent RNA helicase DHX8/PRP22